MTLLPQGPVREKEKRIEKQKREERDLIWRLCHQVLALRTQFPSGMTVMNNKKKYFGQVNSTNKVDRFLIILKTALEGRI